MNEQTVNHDWRTDERRLTEALTGMTFTHVQMTKKKRDRDSMPQN